jgi:hypothetical protein
VRAQVDRDLTTVSCFDPLLGLIKNLGRHKHTLITQQKIDHLFSGIEMDPEEIDEGK